MRVRRPSLPVSVAVLLALGFLVPGSLTLMKGVPEPKVHDEYAYILAAETFTMGRITNPTHPMAEHLETYHVFFRPTYQGKYPPGQGAFLALGRLLAGHEIVGVWLSFALACAALCWMLRAVVPPGWALFGGALPLLSSRLVHLWGDGYWGGAVALLGGALFFGAALRVVRRLDLRDGLAMGAGILILANSRPMEGAATVALAAIPLLVVARGWWRRGRAREFLLRLGLPVGALLLLTAVWTLFYNYTVTGDAFLLPWLNWRALDSVHELIRSYTDSPDRTVGRRLDHLWKFFVGPVLSLPVLAIPLLFRDRRVLLGLAIIAPVTVLSLAVSVTWAHYLAPVLPIVYGILVLAIVAIAGVRFRGRSVGLGLAIALALAQVGLGLSQTWRAAEEERRRYARLAEMYEFPWRGDVIRSLEEGDARYVVFVRYLPGHSYHHEYVYNAADIDAAKIVWAHDMGEERNRELLEYYPDRTALLLQKAGRPVSLGPYPER